jgi:small subunit ribosomal protein S18
MKKKFGSKKPMFRKKTCRFCADHATHVDYKERDRLTKFLTEKGKIIPRRTTGNCAKHQRMLKRAIKRARHAAVIAFQEV